DELTIHIIDSGIGIAADQIPGLFEKFTAIDDSTTTKYSGPGLGLALSQKLCRLMGGEIIVESQIDKGSRFTIRLPLPPAPQAGDDDGRAEATLVPSLTEPGHAVLQAAAPPQG
ncbi:ATP-binding protein, partial [Rhodopseudomonas palustris]